MVSTTQEFLDLLFWKLHSILDQEGVSVLQWAFMQRALNDDNGVPFSVIFKATTGSKDNVRRAAKSLQVAKVGKVIAAPSDGRARVFILTKFGRKRTLHIMEAFKEELLASIGAREIFSKRAQQFTRHMWHASIYLASGDLAQKEMVAARKDDRAAVSDNSLRYVELPKRKKPLFKEPEKVPF
jgi:hypothetical protein